MSGFVCLTDSDTGLSICINVDNITAIVQHSNCTTIFTTDCESFAAREDFNTVMDLIKQARKGTKNETDQICNL